MNTKVRLITAAITAALLLSGCNVSVNTTPEPAQEETPAAEPGNESAAAEAETKSEVTAAEDENEPPAGTSVYEDPKSLPEYTYQGDEKYMDVICKYMVDYEKQFTDNGQVKVYIPFNIIVETDESDPDDILVYGSYNVDGFRLLNTTLFTESGSRSFGTFHLKTVADGKYEVTDAELPLVEEECEELFAPIDGLYKKISETYDKEADKARADSIAQYVSANSLNITQWQDFGHKPVAVEGAAPTSDADNIYHYDSPLGYSIDFDLRDVSLNASDDDMFSKIEDIDTGTLMVIKSYTESDPDKAVNTALSDADTDMNVSDITLADFEIGDGIKCRRGDSDVPLDDGRIFRYVCLATPASNGTITLVLTTTIEKDAPGLSADELVEAFNGMLSSFCLPSGE
ncbi:MAG: hypothetical protein K6E49_03830 [Lachnospiraceae bacterium]|nr:hypothetical protein [Lachnospiraceae bacterium]